MDADDVAFGKALLERKQRSADRLRCGRIGEGIMGKYPAAESRQQLGDARADGSQTDQPDSGGALGVPIPPSTGALVAGYRSGGGVGKMPAPASHPRPPTCPYCRGCDSAGANAFQTEWGRRGSTRHGRRQGIGQPDVTAGGPGHRGADPNGSANTAVRVGSSPTPPAIVKSTVCGTVRSFVGKATSTVVGAG